MKKKKDKIIEIETGRLRLKKKIRIDVVVSSVLLIMGIYWLIYGEGLGKLLGAYCLGYGTAMLLFLNNFHINAKKDSILGKIENWRRR